MISWRWFFDEKDFETFRLEPNDILLNEGQSFELVGRPARYTGEAPGSCFTNTIVRFRAFEGVHPQFAYLVFLDQMKSGRFQDIAKRTVNIAHLGSGRFSDLEFPLPSSEEQAEIVRQAESLLAYADRLESAHEAARAKVEQLPPALLAKAFRGELVPQDPSDEPASLLLHRIRADRAETQAKPKRSKTTRRKKMAKLTAASLRELVLEMPEDHFTFDDLRARASADYESLRDAIFSLLADSDSGFQQSFDSEASEMRFVRTKS